MNYADAGVSLARADEEMVGVKKSVRSTFNKGVLGDVGNFGGLFTLNHLGMKDPVLVSSVDGVGTKLKIDIEMGTHELPGQDIVNHCCDDILVQGARPLFFLDYVATGRLEPGVMDSLVAGMSKACRENDLVLIGGETAEMPGFYPIDEYDLAGFSVGIVDREKVVDKKQRAVNKRRLAGTDLLAPHGAGLAVDQDFPLLDDDLGLAAAAHHIGQLQQGIQLDEFSFNGNGFSFHIFLQLDKRFAEFRLPQKAEQISIHDFQ